MKLAYSIAVLATATLALPIAQPNAGLADEVAKREPKPEAEPEAEPKAKAEAEPLRWAGVAPNQPIF